MVGWPAILGAITAPTRFSGNFINPFLGLPSFQVFAGLGFSYMAVFFTALGYGLRGACTPFSIVRHDFLVAGIVHHALRFWNECLL